MSSARSGSVAASASRDAAQRQFLPIARLLMELAMSSARSGSVAASASRDAAQRRFLQRSSVMELAMSSARSGSVAASAGAMPLSADSFQ